jgi:hypothetical protein
MNPKDIRVNRVPVSVASNTGVPGKTPAKLADLAGYPGKSTGNSSRILATMLVYKGSIHAPE